MTKSIIALTAILFMSSCTLTAGVSDISEVDLSFAQPSLSTFTNKTSFDFKVKFNSDNKNLKPENAKVLVYEGTDCDPDKIVDTRSLNSETVSASSHNLKNGNKYSARVIIYNNEKAFQSVCSSWVGIDTENPDAVSLNYPNNDGYITSKQLFASWSTSTDHGISGLRDLPYRVRLFGQPACAGTASQTAESSVENHIFKGLTHGAIYSVLVSAVDKAGNESIVTCSPYTEIDVYAPGFSLSDATSVPGYSRTLNPTVHFTNDSQAEFWCITPDTAFRPFSVSDACPSGMGNHNGWHTSRPTTLPLSASNGIKAFNLWAFRSNGTPLSQNVTSAAVTLDRTLPGNFSVSGVTAETNDDVIDNWLTSNNVPILHWQASADATDYTVQILNSSLDVVCERNNFAAATSIELKECTGLQDQETYTVVMQSFDIARNMMTAASYNFTVDRQPPGAFTIAGVSGGPDVDYDNYFGVGLPTIHFTSATATTHYEVEIRNAANVSVCSLGTKVAPTNEFNYATEAGMSCVLLDGEVYNAYVRAFDDGRNKTLASNNGFSFTVDTQNPILSITSSAIAITQSTSASFTFSAADTSSGLKSVQCSLDGVGYTTCISPQNFSSLTEGSHQFQVKAVDFAGNVSIRSESWIVDLTNPVLAINSQPAAVSNVAVGTVTFSATDTNDIATYQCSLDGAAFTTCTGAQNFTVAEGTHSFVVRALDPVGWYDEKAANFLVDLTVPTATITDQPALVTASVNPSFDFTGTDSGGSGLAYFECSWNAGPFNTCDSPASLGGVSDGTHSFAVRPVDFAGNVGLAQSYTWIVHASGPTMSWDVVPSSPDIATSASASFHATIIPELSVSSYECSLNGSAYAACSSPHGMTGLTLPSYTLSVRAIDSLGVRGPAISTTWLREIVVTIAANANNVNVESLFSAVQWSGTMNKRVKINTGVIVGSLNPTLPALRSSSGWSGTLTIENNGSIFGAGGLANSGVGGTAFAAEAANVYLTNTGHIYGGGGGGGAGAVGGTGNYSSSYTYREPASGYYFSYGPWTYWPTNGQGAWWFGELLPDFRWSSEAYHNGWTYQRGVASDGNSFWSIARYQSRTQTVYTTGGAGGAGGRGQGSDGVSTSGLVGSTGGTNAGTGGSGAAGGAWGQPGGAGSSGTSGNYATSPVGIAGGAAGYSILNFTNVVLTNSGTILGRQ